MIIRLCCQRSAVKIPTISCLNPSVQIKRSVREIMRFERPMGEIFDVMISISDQVQCFLFFNFLLSLIVQRLKKIEN